MQIELSNRVRQGLKPHSRGSGIAMSIGSSSSREDRSSYGANSDLIGTARLRISTVHADAGLGGEIGPCVNPGFIEESLRDGDGHIRAQSDIECVAGSAIQLLNPIV